MYHALRPTLTVKPLQEHPRSCRASGARPAGPLTRPHGEAFAKPGGKNVPISRFQHLREPQWQTHRCSGATVGDSPRGPLKQQGNPRLKHATKPNTPRLTMQDTTHATEAPNGPPRRPSRRSPRAGFAPLEDARPPRVGSVPFEGEHLPRAGSASLEGPLNPRTGSASLEGSTPSNEVRVARGRPARVRLLPYAGI
jgi:hypothetical protein